MKVSKGTFRIITQHGWKTKEGTVGYDFPFYIFREEDHKGTRDWNLSHIASGYSITKGISLKQAKRLAKQLKTFPLFLFPDVESIKKEQDRMKQKGTYSNLLDVIRGAHNEQ